MLPRERFHAALDLQMPDRIPIFYQHLGAAKWLLQHTGLRMHDGFHDPETYARLSLAARELYGFDNVMAGWGDILIEAQAHGTTWKFPERDFYPRADRYVPMAEVDRIHTVDPMEDRFWSVQLKAAGLMMDRVGREMAVVGGINSPMVIASELVGLENLLMAYLTDPALVEQALKAIVGSSNAYGERLGAMGVEDMFIENALAGEEMVSLEMYEMYDRKYLQMVMDSYRRNGHRVILHNCSTQPFWRSQLETGPTALHIQVKTINVEEFFAALKGKVCAMPGIDHMELMFQRTPDEVEAEVKRVLGLWGRDPGIMIAPGCEMPYKTPRENITRLRESVERYGRMM